VLLLTTKLVLLRHGESQWNKENRFTGWTDVDLSEKGKEEAKNAGQKLKKDGLVFDAVFTSVLKRAVRTTWIALDEMDLMWLPITNAWQLNERHYGALQGLNKLETVQKYGEEQVMKWRRGYSTRPPALEQNDERHPKNDARYKTLLPSQLPACESLEDTVARTLPYWNEKIAPLVEQNKTVLVSAHGNSLRAIVKVLDGLAPEVIEKTNIPTGIPLVYEFERGTLTQAKHYYQASQEELDTAVNKVVNQTKK